MAQQMRYLKASLETTDGGYEDIRQQPKIYAKNSLDRFGDDLCALIVSYLTFEDRFRYECVSKQFRRTVFGSVVDITFIDRYIHRVLNEKTIDRQMLATIAIKCTNIQIIDFREMYLYESRVPEVLAIFRDNCRHLREIYCNVIYNKIEWFHGLGSLVTRIGRVAYTPSDTFRYCNRLSELVAKYLPQMFPDSDRNPVHTLKRLSLEYYGRVEDNQLLAAIVANNQSLASLTVTKVMAITVEFITEFTDLLSRLPQLRQLSLNLHVTGIPYSVDEFLRTIAANCKQLKRLSFGTVTHSCVLTLDSLLYFSQLKRLDLTLNLLIGDYRDIESQFMDPLTLCHGLTHLTLNVWNMNTKFITYCGNRWPRLQYLAICDKYYIIDNVCLDHISRLPALQTLVFECNIGFGVNDHDFEDLLSRSPKLKNIETKGNNISKCYLK
ncbi:unnamed protein product [Medioppia subpectinata]|uniref:F-box domain-containing protein n=1 Tax=Medioppia subpectinata TaxID=1979941 RepID=A0A7R9KUD8_9ACAR|nr:unnamed protein product [Medioppia subpectinata]CAG2108656.1 unnamed protein product [Medioppia subpectinata]